MCFKGSYRYFYSLTIIYYNKMLLIPFLRFCMVLVACEVIIRSAMSVIFYAMLTSTEKLLPLYLFVYFFFKISDYKKGHGIPVHVSYSQYTAVLCWHCIFPRTLMVYHPLEKFIVLKNTQILNKVIT